MTKTTTIIWTQTFGDTDMVTGPKPIYSSSSIFWGGWTSSHISYFGVHHGTSVLTRCLICKFPNRLTITCHHFVPRNPGSGTRGQDHCTDQAAEPSLEPKSFGRCRPAPGLIRWIEDLWGWKKKPMVLWKNEAEWGLLWIYYGLMGINGET